MGHANVTHCETIYKLLLQRKGFVFLIFSLQVLANMCWWCFQNLVWNIRGSQSNQFLIEKHPVWLYIRNCHIVALHELQIYFDADSLYAVY